MKKFIRNNAGVFLVIATMAFVRTAVADWNRVPSGSMEPTLFDGDWLLVNKTAYGASIPFANIRLTRSNNPKRGDIITFVPPHTDDLYVKRVVGIPGDQIGFSARDVFVNGQKLDYVQLEAAQKNEIGREVLGDTSHLIQYGPGGRLLTSSGHLTVPPDQYFVLGDHRNNSADSRYWGFVSGERIMGKVTHVAFSLSKKRPLSERIAIELQ